jgi:UDP-N-acetylglucosamine acyltransferase
VGSHVVLSNNVLLAGHVVVEDWVVLSGAVGSHHFVTFGQHSFVGGLAGVTKDVPPYMIADGHPASVRGVNFRGLKRRGFTEQQIDCLKTAYRMLFKDLTPQATQTAELERLYPGCHEIQMLLLSLRNSIRGKYGRYRESMRGKAAALAEDEDPPPHVS